MKVPDYRYLTDDYLDKNPTWDVEDSAWKAERVASMLDKFGIHPESICEVGCGAGRILETLAARYLDCRFFGYDIAPAAANFWKDIDKTRISLKVGDFFDLDHRSYRAILLLDVLEHVADPHLLLSRLKERCEYLVVHFPLDLSASSVLREKPLLHVRRKVGHIHYFTKGLALELMIECGYEVVDYCYTGSAFNAPQAGLKTKLAQIPRRIAYAINKDWGVRLLGGETLMVLAKAK